VQERGLARAVRPDEADYLEIPAIIDRFGGGCRMAYTTLLIAARRV
jgi:hypothetical protein